MTSSMMKHLIGLGFAVAITAGAVTPSSADWLAPNSAQRFLNTYPTYHAGEGGCIQDYGYGRVQQGCD
ncbi:MAG TPA: hypothetical protein VHA77_00850 [Xanthobacteraceae bacterium]|jgi:hypothetical protein|nr:hypothetical protein [Xanthobacteraceae bacterium]